MDQPNREVDRAMAFPPRCARRCGTSVCVPGNEVGAGLSGLRLLSHDQWTLNADAPAWAVHDPNRSFAMLTGSFRPYVCLANYTAEVFILFAKKRSEIRAAHSDWIKPLGD